MFPSKAAILDWAENRHDQSIFQSDFRQIVVQAASMESPKNRGGPLTNPLSQRCESTDVHANADAPAKTEGGKESERTRGPDQVHWSFLLVTVKTSRSPTIFRPERQRREQQRQ